MEYKGYLARVRFDDIGQRWEGEVVGLAHIRFQAKELDDVEHTFQEALDHYLERKKESEALLKELKTQFIEP